jgi:hypothetical protein
MYEYALNWLAKGNPHHVSQHPGMVNLLPHQIPFPPSKQRGHPRVPYKPTFKTPSVQKVHVTPHFS